MSGRPWNWVAAGTAAAAVVGAVLLQNTSSVSSFVSEPFATVDYKPDVGSPILVTPTVDATTVRQTPAPTPPKQTSAAPKPVHESTRLDAAEPTKWTITIPIPDFEPFFPDCETAKMLGKAPIRRGEPGYREGLDRDRDGVACER
ncbi:excalibur calcium-binding domain-containing protein [Kibdelosporangium philippinense]|uniref:Excalibur calcium-binding domain-containing protein n=1 Tax=Kibdelosporangium philippinense TaxID=211113 RepID=A0ABS8ZPG5_9PSEU|nr:excalibur calcium-binding domain-containing protein [Kibdelosporangium philippinense]MCE7009497.1 excalibur calcium-binding domain-containing protein [Kibdelosporangium philippinense]